MMYFLTGIFCLLDLLMIGRWGVRSCFLVFSCLSKKKKKKKFLGILYSIKVNRDEEDLLCWTPARSYHN